MQVEKKIVNNDTFLNMSVDAQVLYFHLCANATEDGFVYNSQGILRMLSLDANPLTEIISLGFANFVPTGIKICSFAEYIEIVVNEIGE